MPDYLDQFTTPAPAKTGDYLDQFATPKAPTIVSEGLKAPARVTGGVLSELGEAGQYLTGNRIGGGLRRAGEAMQERNAVDPQFAQEHPVLTQVGQAAEGVAQMAPYLVGDAMLSAVAPPVGAAGAAGLVARGLRLASGKLSTAALPVVIGAATGQRSYERAQAQGMDSDQALKASLLPAATSAAGMALMGKAGQVGRKALPVAKGVAGDIAAAVAVDTPVMVGTNMATAKAQEASGITPERTPGQIAKDPKEWLSAALTGGMFGALHATQRGVAEKAISMALADVTRSAEERSKVVNFVGAPLPEGEERNDWVHQAHEAVAKGEPIEAVPAVPTPELVAPTPEAAKDQILGALVESASTGEGAVDALHRMTEEQALAEISARIDEAHASVVSKADQFIQAGTAISKHGEMLDPGVLADLRAKGYEAVPGASDLTGSVRRQTWEIKPREVLDASSALHTQEAGDETIQEAGRTQEGLQGQPEQAAQPDRVAAADAEAAGGGQEGAVPAEVTQDPGSLAKLKDTQIAQMGADDLVEQLTIAGLSDQAIAAIPPEGRAAIVRRLASAAKERQQAPERLTRAAENKKLAEAGYSGRAIKKLKPDEREAALAQIKLKETKAESPKAIQDGGPASAGPSRPAIKDGEIRRLTQTEAVARQGDKVILGVRNAEGNWDHVATAEKNSRGEFVVDAADAETPEAAARLISVLRTVGLEGGSKYALGGPDARRGKGSVAHPAEGGALAVSAAFAPGVDGRLSDVAAEGGARSDVRGVEGADEVLDAKRVQKAFPGQKVSTTEAGFEVTTKSGVKIRVEPSGEIYFDKAAAEAALGRAVEPGEVPVASFEKLGKEGLISLTERGVGELDHEAYHAAEALALTKRQIDLLRKRYGSEENAAKAYQKFRDGSKDPSGFFAKIMEMLVKLRDLVMPNADSVFRKIASGEVWTQKKGEGSEALRKYMVEALQQPEAAQVAAKFSFGPKSKDSVKAATEPVQENELARVLKGAARGFYNTIMPVDRVISMAMSSPAYRPIAEHLKDLQKWQDIRGNYASGVIRDASILYDQHVSPVLKTDAEVKAFDTALYTASLYQMSDKANEWTAREWAKSGLQKATGKTLAEARQEVLNAVSALTPEQQAARKKVLEHVQDLRQQHIEALEDNIRGMFSPEVVDRARAFNKGMADAREILTGAELRAEEARLRAEAGPEAAAIADPIERLDDTKNLRGDYFPLMRFGNHVVTGTVGGKPYRAQFDTQIDAKKELAALKAAGAEVRYDYQDGAAMREEANIPLNFLDKYRGILEAQGVEGKAADNVMNDLKALWVNTLSQYSFRSHLLQRKSVAGYEEDAHKTFLTYARRFGQAISNTRYGGKIEQQFRDMANRIDQASAEGARPESIKLMRELHNRLYAQHIDSDGEKLSEITKMVTKGTFLYYLSSPSVWAVQWSQPFMTTIPKFAVEHGVGRAMSVFGRAARNYIAGHYSDAKLDEFETRTGGLGEKTFRLMEELWSLPDNTSDVVETAKQSMEGERQRAAEAGASPQELASLKVKHEAELHKAQAEATRKQAEARKALTSQIDAAYEGLSRADQELLTLNLTARQGLRDLSISHNAFDAMLSSGSVKGQADKLVPGTANAYNKTMELLALPMQKSETGSRTAAAVAAVELARSKGMGYAEAHAYARDVITDTLFNFSQANRPEWMKGNVGRIVGQFQLYRLHMLGKTVQLTKTAIGRDVAERMQAAEAERERNASIFGDEEAGRMFEAERTQILKGRDQARKELAYMTGMGMALAGAAGTPLAMVAGNSVTNALWEGMKLLFSDPDDPWDPKQSFENAVKDSLGETGGSVFLKGLPALVGWDISRRIGSAGMADFIQGDPPPGLTGTARANWYAGRILGPSFGMVSDGFRASQAAQNGDIAGAMQASSPKFIKDFAKMLHTADSGVQAGGKTIVQPEDVGPYEMALMMIGISPLEVSLAQETSRDVANLSATLSARRSSLLKQFTAAQLEGDMDKRQEVLEAVNAWGQRNPKLKISMPELLGAAKRGMVAASGVDSKRETLLKEELGEM